MLDYGFITSATCPTACDRLQVNCGRRATSQAGGDCWKPIFKCSTRCRNQMPQIRSSRLRRALTLVSSGQWTRAYEIFRSIRASTPEAHRLHKECQVSTGLLLNQIATFMVSLVDHSLFSANVRTPEAWAGTMMFLSRAACVVLGIGDSLIEELDARILGSVQVTAAAQRKKGKLQEAKKSAERVFAYAHLLVARIPDRSASHLAMSDAYSQICKNAWRDDDRVRVERNLKLALDEARRALSLDPTNARAVRCVPEYERRLRELVAAE